jgi:hypothetical protein
MGIIKARRGICYTGFMFKFFEKQPKREIVDIRPIRLIKSDEPSVRHMHIKTSDGRAYYGGIVLVAPKEFAYQK